MALLACAREAACGVTSVRIDHAFGLVRVARHGRLDVGHAHFDGHVYGSDWLLFTNGCFAEQRQNYCARTTACAQYALFIPQSARRSRHGRMQVPLGRGDLAHKRKRAIEDLWQRFKLIQSHADQSI